MLEGVQGSYDSSLGNHGYTGFHILKFYGSTSVCGLFKRSMIWDLFLVNVLIAKNAASTTEHFVIIRTMRRTRSTGLSKKAPTSFSPPISRSATITWTRRQSIRLRTWKRNIYFWVGRHQSRISHLYWGVSFTASCLLFKISWERQLPESDESSVQCSKRCPAKPVLTFGFIST